ncbi:hypothetical protein WA026_001881 [Henosepilachna vigintioctopunctata]|uniref:alkaline phosphatase n=1 Tax=Henosepilachna vigintioctopunctata TaxID=420089 RepID=A0AAW1UVT3_9CUCU
METWFVLVSVVVFLLEINVSSAAIRVASGKPAVHEQRKTSNPEENTPEYWNNVAQAILQKAKAKKPNTNKAKNVILFLGDGMSLPTVTAARIYEGGESNLLSFEKFPYTAVSKTYCVDRQVSESSSTATAYLCGTKANWYTSGVTGAVKMNDCEASILPENQVSSIAAWSQLEGKWTGFVTTTRITHASPSALYAHAAHKDWESDADMVKRKQDPLRCPDIAKQLIDSEVGQNFHVILGCGRNKFLPKEVTDEEGKSGHRLDKMNLIDEWKTIKEKDMKKYEYVWNRDQLLQVDNDTDYLLGLFEDDLCKFHVDRDPNMDPTLEEMTKAAIRKLSKSPNGYFLFVEGGMIDQAHHRSEAGKALVETMEFSKAIRSAVDITNDKDTLIVVTADHAHTMSFGGYPKRGSNVLGLTDFSDVFPINESLPILSYANGPGYRPEINGTRHNYTADIMDFNYKYPGLFKTFSETHGGDDVLIYAKGPWSHLFEGVMEQNAIPHLMAYASCVGDKSTACKDDANIKGSGSSVSKSFAVILYFQLVLMIVYVKYFIVILY